MAERICETCGAKNDASARFCVELRLVPRLGLGRSTLGGDALTGTVPLVVGSVPTEPAPPPTAPAPPQRPHPRRMPGPSTLQATSPNPRSRFRMGRRHRSPSRRPPPPVQQPPRPDAPVVTVATPEVTLTPDAPGQVEFAIENASSIVDGYDVERRRSSAVARPRRTPTSTSCRARSAASTMSLGMRPGTLVVAQRVTLTFLVRSAGRSGAHAPRSACVATVPPQGPRPRARGAADPHPARGLPARARSRSVSTTGPRTTRRRWNCRASDPESVVRFAFAPEVVEVPAGSMVEAAVDVHRTRSRHRGSS